MRYRPGYFSEPVKAWPGLREYVPVMYERLIFANGMGAVEMAQRARDSREARLNSDNADTKFVAKGTVSGMGHAMFKDKPAPNSVGRGAAVRRAETFEGKDCTRRHGGRRYRSTGACVECAISLTLIRKKAKREARA